MKQMVRGAIAILALSGLAACVDDPLLPLNGDADRIANDRVVANVRQGDSVAVLLRLTNAADRATPTTFEITNVGAGIAVNRDPKFRPEYVNGSDTLVYPEVKSVQRYFIRGIAPGEFSYTVSSSGISATYKVRVEPIDLGAALSRTTAVAGDDVTITAPAGTSFTAASAVTFTTGALAVKSRAADNKSIVVTVGPGITGPATVTGLKLDYFPALPALTLASTNTLTTPALTAAPLAYSATNLAADAPVTVTATGFKFKPNSVITFNGVAAVTTALAADSNSITIVPPAGLTARTGVVSNISLSFLTGVNLTELGSTAAITTATAGAAVPLAGTAVADANTPTITVGGNTTGGLLIDGGTFTAASPFGGGGPIRYYRLVVTGATQNRTIRLFWAGGTDPDLDFYIRNAANNAFVGSTSASAGSSNPEQQTVSLAAGTYYIAVIDFGGPTNPSRIRIEVQ